MQQRLYLASASPRRLEILTLAGYSPVVCPAPADESAVLYDRADPEGYVRAIAQLKNDAAFARMDPFADSSAAVLLSADTVVISPDGDALGKPKDRCDAVRMLHLLSGRVHRVLTGVVLRELSSGKTVSFTESTSVRFRTLTDEEIAAYADSGEPLDKAGAYGIQGRACTFADRLEGDYYNVVGLPIARVTEALRTLY